MLFIYLDVHLGPNRGIQEVMKKLFDTMSIVRLYILFTNLFIIMCEFRHAHGCQRTIFKDLFFFFPSWVPRIELTLPGSCRKHFYLVIHHVNLVLTNLKYYFTTREEFEGFKSQVLLKA